jgi:hypothetical protein
MNPVHILADRWDDVDTLQELNSYDDLAMSKKSRKVPYLKS